jgi:hypothetical protein
MQAACHNQEYTVTSIHDGLITIDGEPTEQAWFCADRIYSFSNPWNKDNCPTTSIAMLKDSKYLYFYFEAKDHDLILVSDLSNERDIEKEDRVELFISKDQKMAEYYGFEIDAKGRVLAYAGKYYRQFDYAWDLPEGFDCSVRISPKGYATEIGIPIEFIYSICNENKFLYFGAFRAEFSRKGDQIIENWLTLHDPHTAYPDFHVPLSLKKLIINEASCRK